MCDIYINNKTLVYIPLHQIKNRKALLFIWFSSFLLLYLIVFGSDVIDKGHGVENKKLDGTVIGIERIKLVRLFEEQLLEYVQFLLHIIAEPVD